MQYWYPPQGRTAQLTGSLRDYEAVAAQLCAHLDECLPQISAAFADANGRSDFPKQQIPRWVWVGAQFRLAAPETGSIALKAGAALTFLQAKLRQPLHEADLQDLNWVLDTTVRELSELVAPGSLRSCLSAGELAAIEERLEAYGNRSDFSEAGVRSAVSRQIEQMRRISGDDYLSTLGDKIEALFAAASRSGDEGKAARAALLYLADEQDIVSDSQGVLGLLDDLYVIEWAYAVAESQTRCLPLLEGLLERYPFVGDLALVGDPERALDRYGQYVTCAGMDALFAASGPSLLVVREAGPLPLISAVFASVQAARLTADGVALERGSWGTGDPVVLSDGARTFKAIYLGEITFGDQQRIRLGVRGNGSLTVPFELAPYMARCNQPHKSLSDGKQIGEWLKTRHVDPLINLTGAARHLPVNQQCVLLLGPRHRLDEFLDFLTPLGGSVGALLGARYVTSEGRYQDLKGSTTETPYLYACSDAETAYDLVRNPPDHVTQWRVIVDGAKAGAALLSALSSDGEKDSPPIGIFSELHDREPTLELAKRGLSTWYLEDQDVEVPPLVARRPPESANPVDRGLRRQALHWVAVRSVHEVSCELLERTAEWMRRAAAGSEEDDGLRNLELLVSAFVQRAIASPLAVAVDKTRDELARGIASQAAMQRLYNPLAAELHAIFAEYSPDFLAGGRLEKLLELAGGGSIGRGTAVVCRSVNVAKRCEEAARAYAPLAQWRWVNLEGLRCIAPIDRLVVPGWLDRLSIRELVNNGYATALDFVFYPFERRWFDATVAANVRWERNVEERSLAAMSSVASRLAPRGTRDIWNAPAAARLRSGAPAGNVLEFSPTAELPEFERLEARAVEALRRSAIRGREHQPTRKAQLVLFEEPGAYAFLPPDGKVIVLQGREGRQAQAVTVGEDAERLLFRSVSGLEPGFLLALPLRGERDLVDARADQFIADAQEVRRLASLWRAALLRYQAKHTLEHTDLARRLAGAGHKRHAGTVRYWLTNTHTIAPRGYRAVVPAIAQLTQDSELNAELARVLEDIDLIYRARELAAQAIVRELFAGEIDLEADELTFALGGSQISYALRRIRRVEGVYDVPHELVGRARRLDASVSASPQSLTNPPTVAVSWPR